MATLATCLKPDFFYDETYFYDFASILWYLYFNGKRDDSRPVKDFSRDCPG